MAYFGALGDSQVPLDIVSKGDLVAAADGVRVDLGHLQGGRPIPGAEFCRESCIGPDAELSQSGAAVGSDG